MQQLTKTTDPTINRAFALAEGEGKAIWFLGSLMVTKADGRQTDNRFDLVDQTVPPGYAPPWHRHDADEAWYVLEGTVIFYCGEAVVAAERGSWVFGPKNVRHTFKVGEQGARLLTLAVPSGFGDFVAEFGEVAQTPTLPPPAPVDVERLIQVAGKYGIEIIGGPPA